MNMSLFNGAAGVSSKNNNNNNFQKAPNNNKQILDHSRSTSPSSGAEDCSTASSLCTSSNSSAGACSSGRGMSAKNSTSSAGNAPPPNLAAPVFHPRQTYEHNTNNNNNALSALSEEQSSLTPTMQTPVAGSGNVNFNAKSDNIWGSAQQQHQQPTASGSSTPPSMASLPLSVPRSHDFGSNFRPQQQCQQFRQQQQQPQMVSAAQARQDNANQAFQQQQANFYPNSSVPAGLGNFMSKRDSQNTLYKTELCRSFVETGSCRYGNKCQFAHGGDEVRNLSRHPKYKTEMCRSFHTTGHCPYGTRCHFIHDLPPNQHKNSLQNVRTSPIINHNQHHHHNNNNAYQANTSNNGVWASGGASMADKMRGSNSNVTISHESTNRFSSGFVTENNSNCWSNVVKQENDYTNFRTPVKFDLGWNESNANAGESYNSNNGFNNTLDWGREQRPGAASNSSIFSESLFSNPTSGTKINNNPHSSQQRFDTAWSTNVDNSKQQNTNKTLTSSERTPSSSIFDQNNNPLDDDFNPTGFFNDVFSQMSVQDKQKKKQQEDASIFGGASLFETKRTNNSTSTSSNRSHRLPVFQELTDNI